MVHAVNAQAGHEVEVGPKGPVNQVINKANPSGVQAIVALFSLPVAGVDRGRKGRSRV